MEQVHEPATCQQMQKKQCQFEQLSANLCLSQDQQKSIW